MHQRRIEYNPKGRPLLKKSTSMLGLAALLVVVYILGGSLKKYIFSASSAKAPSCLEMLGSTITENGGVAAITGSIKNNCGQKYGSIQVSFTLDPAGNLKSPPAKAVAYGEDLLPGKTWDFRTLPVPKNSTYRFNEISAY